MVVVEERGEVQWDVVRGAIVCDMLSLVVVFGAVYEHVFDCECVVAGSALWSWLIE